MASGYDYLDLTTAQKHARRALLDQSGYNVLLTQLLLLGLYHLLPHLPCPNPVRRLNALLTTPLHPRKSEYRTARDWLLITAYILWCLHLSARYTHPDYLHLTKSLGHVAAANLPLHFLLATKHLFPALLHTSYDRLTFAHGWTGRIITLLMSAHVALYLNFFYDTNRMGTRFWETDVQCGVWGFVLWITIATVALPKVRRWSYRLFFAVHVWAPVVMPLLVWHVEHLRVYVYAAGAVWGVDSVWRWRRRVSGEARVVVAAEGLVVLEVALEKKWIGKAGGHVRLKIPEVSKVHSNPFTVAAVTPGGVRLVARVREGVTRMLAGKREVAVVLEGPYGGGMSEGWDRMLVVAGGVGGTFCVPMVAEALKTRAAEGVRFIWVVKTVEDCRWGLDDEKVAKTVEVYITGKKEEDGSLELEDEGVVKKLAALGVAKDRVHVGRPDLKGAVHELGMEQGHKEVVCCGPVEMGIALKTHVARLQRTVPVTLHVEEFGN